MSKNKKQDQEIEFLMQQASLEVLKDIENLIKSHLPKDAAQENSTQMEDSKDPPRGKLSIVWNKGKKK